MILDVPYQSQKPLEKSEKKDWCALASLWMVMAYYLKEATPTLEELHKKYGPILESSESFKEVGIIHTDLLKIARDYELSGFRKSWFVQPGVQSLLDKFKSEGETEEDIKVWDESNTEESLFTLQRWINMGLPVIISVSPEFSPSKKTHIIVLIGVDENNFVLHDPYIKGDNYRISKEEFKKFWLRQAIIIQK